MRYFLSVVILLGFFAGYSQTGHYFLSHCSPGDKRIDAMSFDMAQDNNGVLHFATRTGVLAFDGRNWELIPAYGAVYAVEATSEGEIFWCGSDGFGKISTDAFGNFVSTKLSNDQKEVYEVITLDNQVYFMSDEEIVIYNNKNTTSIKSTEATGLFTSLIEVFGTPYVLSEKGKYFKIDAIKLSDADLGGGLDFAFSIGSADKYLLGTTDNRLFLCSQNLTLKEIPVSTNDYLRVSKIVDGVWLSPSLVALATLRGGVVFINPNTGTIEEIVNYATGLPDNEVYSILRDKNDNVWVSHDYGFTCISTHLPFRSFSHYNNIAGNLLCALSFNNEIYVGTSVGLFKLKEEQKFDEITYYEDIIVAQTDVEKSETEIQRSQKDEALAKDESTKKKKGFLRFLKRNRNEIDKSAPTTEKISTTPTNKAAVEKPTYKRIRKTQRIFRASEYVYQKVDGVDAKVTHLAVVENNLIAGGVGGLFLINNLAGKLILEEPVRFLFAAKSSVIASTYNNRIYNLQRTPATWEIKNTRQVSDDEISYGFAAQGDEFWLCGVNKIYRGDLKGQAFKTVDFSNSNFSKTAGVELNGIAVFVNSSGFFKVSADGQSVDRIDSLKAPQNYIATGDGILYHDGRHWRIVSNASESNELKLVSVLGDIRFIQHDASHHGFWVINEENELYQFASHDSPASPTTFPLLPRTISQNGKLIAGGKKKINQDDGPVEIKFAQSNYLGGGLMEYRYFLEGIDASWSEWSSDNNKILFTFLPQGNYKLHVQSRDIFGHIIEAKPTFLTVEPPYWKTPWFYAMEFTILALLVWLSFKLTVRYRIVSRLLSLLTIILLIEFIQTIIGFSFSTNSSPLLDFAVQVIVALIILPVEGFLRNLMFKSMGADSKLLEVVAEMERKEREQAR